MAKPQKLRLGDLLVENGVITQDQLAATLSYQKQSGNKLGRELIAQGYISEDELIDFLSRQLKISKVDLNDYTLTAEVANKLPELLSRRLTSMVIKDSRDHYEVAMADPTDIFAYDELSKHLRKPFKVVITRQDDLKSAMDQVFRRSSEMRGLASRLRDDVADETGGGTDLQVDGSDTPVAKFLQTMFEDAVQIGASDIHIEPGEFELHIRLRQDGALHQQTQADHRLSGPLVSRLKLMAGLDISEKRLPQDGRFQITVAERKIDVRMSTIPVQYGESAVMRLLDQSKAILDLENTGMSNSLRSRFRRLIQSPNGVVLVTGPTGSGKTTTLYGALSELNKPDVKILTAEDPVEYSLPGINQVQINSKIGLSFANVLRSFLRQDPDIMLVGEIRDHETMEIAMKAALTGHLVLSTLHTNDAISTAIRLLDMGAEPYLIAATLRGVVAQRLVRKVCERCKEPYSPDGNQWELLHSVWGTAADDVKFMQGRGCTHCHYTGYDGRTAIFEFVTMDKILIRALQNRDLDAFANAAKQQEGYKSLHTCAMSLAAKGLTTVDQVMRVALT